MEAISRSFISQDWITVVLVVCLGLLAITKFAYERRFMDFVTLLSNEKSLGKNTKDIKFEEPFNILLFTVQLLSVSAFVYLIIQHFGFNGALSNEFLFLRVIVCYSLFIGVKFLVERIISVLFDGEEELRRYHYNKLVYRNFLGLILLPINALFAYSFIPGKAVILAIIVVFGLINLFSTINIMRRYEKLIINNLFYFILYICALEIAPYLILYKLISIYILR